MINLDEVEREIKELEARGDTTYSLCERLAWLYIVRDHIRPERADTRKTQELEGSDFLQATSGLSYPLMMDVLNEHMQALKVVQPREYELVMDKLKRLK